MSKDKTSKYTFNTTDLPQWIQMCTRREVMFYTSLSSNDVKGIFREVLQHQESRQVIGGSLSFNRKETPQYIMEVQYAEPVISEDSGEGETE